MRIGILGGTFNPVHNGHLHVARHALSKLRLDKIVFIPVYSPPHKKLSGNAAPSDRIRMLRLATRKEKRFVLSLNEIEKKEKSYSVKTARALRKKYGKKSAIFFLIGADSQRGLSKWREIDKIMKLLRFVVVPRRGFPLGRRSGKVVRIRIPEKNISSTEIRMCAKKGRAIRRLVPEDVAAYIEKKKLYR